MSGMASGVARIHPFHGRGFSIAEMLVAFAIFCVGVLLVLSVFPTSFRAMRQGRILLLATHHARSSMEDLCRTSFASLRTLATQQATQTTAVATRTSTMTVIVNGSQEKIDFQTRIWVRNVPNSLVSVYCEEYVHFAGDAADVWRGVGGGRAAPAGTALPLVKFETLQADKT